MNLDQAVEKAARDIDVLLIARQDRLMEQMIADGCSAEGATAFLAAQHDIDLEWREQALAQVREMLVAHGVR